MTYISWFSDFALYLEGYWGINMIPWNNESVWLDAWPQNKSGSMRPIFHGSVILPYILKAIWCINMIPWNNESVWLDARPQNKSGSLWPIFHGSVILPYILKAIEVLTYLGIMSQYDLMLDLKIKVGHCDLYFMVQWFCLISWRLFDV